MEGWTGHWHGYGPWIGPAAEFAKEGPRRPSKDPDQHRLFLANTMTPTQTGAWLLRPRQASRDRTWTDVDDALAWYEQVWRSNPPGGDVLPIETALPLDRGHLLRGSDISAGYYNPSFLFVAFSIVCCPQPVFFPGVPCPMPPR
ncbi:hypothetical protein [Micromonospora sp. WMMC273]|uniref:hypothetical protein n=1 Tax=Micromonospora sp. WMMC273 TaxID=3015157 RepID=UPI0022B5EB15|nr:hypothetical protein [Micromonospora sp. WMMC273]MCZ7478860.1 hypothetical protein [Micromonospora sp. WMMC273]MCZ7478969.1 hypothetical protein [Micromonospora sp. WMMC273]